MRKLLRTLVPVLLVIAILSSLIWYIFVYDRTFIRDLLISGARFSADFGYKNLSSTFYDMAYNHAGQDENVAIELADQYKAQGNYTRAEYTLTKAIADGGTSELYIALCKTYVEQDKLMDAVAMLDNVADPEIKMELDVLRPSIGNISPTPGFYSQYINVNMEASHGTIYYSTTAEYPSIKSEPYTGELLLPNGETTLYAVAVAEDGLVSPLTLLGYTIGGVVEEVTFEDPAVEAAARLKLSLREDQPVLSRDLWTITEFNVPKEATTLADLAKMNYLTTLHATGVMVDSLQSLSSLNLLQSVDLTGSRFPASDLSVLGNLPDLKVLKLTNCGLSTVAGLENAKSLTQLHLSNNTIRNITPLSTITTLTELYLQHNAVIDLSALKDLHELQTLNVSYNAVATLGGAASLQKLTWLNLEHNQLTNLTGLDQLSNVSYLNVSANGVTKADPLVGCVNLTELDISDNQIESIDSLKALSKLKTLDFANNQVKALPAWSASCALYSIDGSYNQISSLKNLSGLENLAYVLMDYNQITNLSPLAKCHNLVQVNVFGGKVTGVEQLTAQSVIVNYDPTA